jgi:heptosyltransferase-1
LKPVSSAVLQRQYCVLLHGTSRADKLWPVDAWITLGRSLEERGYACLIPWGEHRERERSERIASGLGQASIPPFLDMEKMAELLSGAAAVVGVDTGLVHLAAALGRPVVAIFSGSDPVLTGVFGAPLGRNLGQLGNPPQPEEVLSALLEMKAL